MPNPLQQLSEEGVAVWVDSIARDWLEKGELRRLRDQFSVVGVTSNPTVFQAAIGTGGFYDEQLAALAQQGLLTPAILERLALYNIHWAAHELRPVYQASEGLNGYVSYEVRPGLAHDTDKTAFQAARLFDLLSLPNIMIKIPATVEGLPAIRASIAAGVNVTLVFSVARYREVVEAYLSGLEGREVVQVYASRPDSAVPRPRRWLVGFAAAAATAGEELTVPVVVPLRALQHWDDTIHAWRTEPGTFDLHVGPSSGDLPLHTAIEIPGS